MNMNKLINLWNKIPGFWQVFVAVVALILSVNFGRVLTSVKNDFVFLLGAGFYVAAIAIVYYGVQYFFRKVQS